MGIKTWFHLSTDLKLFQKSRHTWNLTDLEKHRSTTKWQNLDLNECLVAYSLFFAKLSSEQTIEIFDHIKDTITFLKRYEKWTSANMHFLKTKFVIKLSIDA